MRIIAILCIAVSTMAAQVPYTHIYENLTPAMNGSPVTPLTGSITVQAPQFTYNGATVAATYFRSAITNGIIDISLVPTDHDGGCPSNCPTYKITTQFVGQPPITYWSVPTLPASAQCVSPSLCTVREVTVAQPVSAAVTVNAGQMFLPAGNYCISVTANGAWSLANNVCGGSVQLFLASLTNPQLAFMTNTQLAITRN